MKKINLNNLAKALIFVGQENNMVEQLIADLVDVAEKIDQTPELKIYLNRPQITLKQKKQMLKTVFQDFISELIYNFLILIIKNKKLRYLNSIIELVKKEHLKKQEILEVKVESVVVLNDAEEKKLNQLICEKIGKKVVVKNIINKNLIGGLKLTLGDQVIDASILGRIERLREKINQFE